LLASLIVDELETRKKSASDLLSSKDSFTGGLHLAARANRALKTPTTARKLGLELRKIRIGASKVTGSIEIHVPLASGNIQETAANERYADPGGFLFRLKIQLPTWLSWRIVDSAVYQTQIGWTQNLRTYNIYHTHGEPYQKAVSAIRSDDLAKLQQHFAERVLTPLDQWQVPESSRTLLDVSTLLLPVA
jgi:hypothetical protein